MAASPKPETASVAVARYPMLEIVQKRADQLVPFLPKGVTLDQIGQITQMMAIKQPDLLACTPSSLVMGISRGLRAGLELGETWHLLTFKNKDLTEKHGRDVFECTGVADYKGLAQLMVASGAVRYVDPQVVRDGDEFDYELGLEKRLTHRPGGTRGAITHAYVILRLPFGIADFLVMTIKEIDAIRLAKSKQWKNGPCPDWYAKKTVIRQIAKLLPKDKRLMAVARAVEQDEAAEFEDVPEADATEVPTLALASGRPLTREAVADAFDAEEVDE